MEEHIYETIAERTDEPIYSTPYEEAMALQPAALLHNSRSLREISTRSDKRTANSLPNNNNKRNNTTTSSSSSSNGIQRMNKTQDVEHWIRHATVVHPPNASGGESKKRNTEYARIT